jgi:hypothetical protein
MTDIAPYIIVPTLILDPPLGLIAAGVCAMSTSGDAIQVRDCGAERAVAWKECEKLREVHDGSQGKCYDRAAEEYKKCRKAGGKP